MHNRVSAETRAQLEALCRQVTVSRPLDEEIRRELYGHMEDRLLAHLNGSLPLTEQEAFVLVREHFGDPAVVKEQLQGVYAGDAAASLGRRLVAAFAACTAVNALSSVLQLCLGAVPAALGAWREPLQEGLFWVTELVFIPAAMYLVLRAWRKRMERGDAVWFQTRSAGFMAAVLGASTVVSVVSVPFFFWVESVVPNSFDGSVGATNTMAALLSVLIMGAVWIWFCDQPPRTRRNVLLAALGWALALGLISFTAAFQANITGYQILANALGSLITTGVFAALSLGLYRLVTRSRRRVSPPFRTE